MYIRPTNQANMKTTLFGHAYNTFISKTRKYVHFLQSNKSEVEKLAKRNVTITVWLT